MKRSDRLIPRFKSKYLRGIWLYSWNYPVFDRALAFLPQFIPANVTSSVVNMLVLGGVFMGMMLSVFILYGLLANYVRSYIFDSPKIV